MKHLMFAILLLSLLSSGCSSLKVVPLAIDNGRINLAKNTLTVLNNGVEITVNADVNSLNNYNIDSVVSAFQIEILNSTTNETLFAEDSFVLVDENGLQYSMLTPENVREMLKKDSYYLMPYPYVGFYYLEDFQKTNFYNRFNSSLPYYYDLYPQDLFTKALPFKSIVPGMKIEGQIFFKIDFTAHKNLKLLMYRQGVSKSQPAEFIFPFTVVK